MNNKHLADFEKFEEWMETAKHMELIFDGCDDGLTTIPLELWQYEAILQLLGLQIEYDDDVIYSIRYFTKQEVEKRLKQIGVLIPVKEPK